MGDSCSASATERSLTSGPRVRVAGLAIRGTRVLLVQQQKADRTYWLLPGGGVERGETMQDAIVREFREECALTATVAGPPLGLVQVISPDGGLTRHLVQIVYPVALEPSAEPRPSDPAIGRTAWHGIDVIGALALHPPIADAIAAWVAAIRTQEQIDGDPDFIDVGVRWAT